MRKSLSLLLFFFLQCTLLVAQHGNQAVFVKNQRQWSDDILYRADIPSGYMFLYKDAIQYSFYDKAKVRSMHGASHQQNTKINNDKEIKAHGVVAQFLNSNPSVVLEGQDKTSTLRNYYLGKDRSRWASDVSSFYELHYKGLYQGIDMKLFTTKNTLKYEFEVAAQADPNKIKIQYQHAQSIHLQHGALIIETSVNSFKELKPYCYQIINGQEVVVHSRYQLKDDQVSFVFPKGYNKDYPLVIDPELVFSTYSGGTSDNWGNTACFDDSGRLYSGSATFGTNFPNFKGPFVIGGLGGENETAIFCFNSNGTNLDYLTFLGGKSLETPHSLVVDKNRDLLIMGSTGSSNFPVTNFSTFKGGNFRGIKIYGDDAYEEGVDIFVCKLDPRGQLKASTFVGGTGNDGVKFESDFTYLHNYGDQFRGDILTDDDGNIFVASSTRSSSITGFSGSLQGDQDAIVFSLKSDLSLRWGTYFGGSNLDIAHTIKIDSKGNIYIGGGSRSTDLPMTAGSLRPSAGGLDEGYIAKFDKDGNLLKTTYLGTKKADQVYFLDIDNDDNVYAFGQTTGPYPVTAGVYSDPNSGQFIHKLGSDLTTNYWSTVVGSGDGRPDISPTAFLVVKKDNCQNIYIAGWGGENNAKVNGTNGVKDMPVTSDAYRKTTVNGSDFYLGVYSKDMKGFVYGTFFGENSNNESGDHVDGGTCRFSPDGTIYHAVCASCQATNGFPTTPGAWSNRNNSDNCNNAVFKFAINMKTDFDMFDKDNLLLGSGDKVCGLDLKLSYKGAGAERYEWKVYDDKGNVIINKVSEPNFSHSFTEGGEYKVELTAYGPTASCNVVQKVEKTVKLVPTNFKVSEDILLCDDATGQLIASGAVTYQWTPAKGLNNPNIPNPTVKPDTTTVYTVNMTDAEGCKAERHVRVTVSKDPQFDIMINRYKGCDPFYRGIFEIRNNNKNIDLKSYTFIWSINGVETVQGPKVNHRFPDNYDKDFIIYDIGLKMIDQYGCEFVHKKQLKIPKNTKEIGNVVTANDDGVNDTFKIFAENAKVEIFNRWGKRIFKADNYQNQWGKGARNGLYYYLVTAEDGSTCKGWIQVLEE